MPPKIWVELADGSRGLVIGYCPRSKQRVWVIVLISGKKRGVRNVGLEEIRIVRGPRKGK